MGTHADRRLSRLARPGLARLLLAGLALGLSTLAAAPQARADEFIDRVNAEYAKVVKEKRSDLIILPVLAKMDAPPRLLADPLRAALLTPQSKLWSDAETWVKAKPQVDAIEALKKVTAEDNWKNAFAFAQPYGVNAVTPEIAATGLYTELGENPTLALADFKYLGAVQRLELLVHFETTRLANEGKPNDALNLLIHWAYFARQIADRQFLRESKVGTEMLILSLQRMRDVAWQDFKSDKRAMTPEALRDACYKKLDRVRSVLNVQRFDMVRADFEAAQQIVQRVFRSGSADRNEFVRTFSRAAAGQRPLRLFSEGAKWEAIYPMHADSGKTRTKVRDVFGDWERRWAVPPFDRLLRIPTDFAKLDKVQFAGLELMLGDLGEMFPLRNQLRAEAAGTRASLAMYGLYLVEGQWPRYITAVQPRYLREADPDPFVNSERFQNSKDPNLGFFVPTRDELPRFDNTDLADTVSRQSKVEKRDEHIVRVFARLPGLPDNIVFEVPLRAETCIIYSAGPDGNRNAMFFATQMKEDTKGDYLLWPPELSLLRKHLGDTGKLP
jgi:hypothetical protein